MHRLTHRTLTPELMDAPDADPAELAAALAVLRRVNRRLGGAAACLRALRRWSRNWTEGRTIRLLDIGTGSADIPRAITTWARGAGHRVEVTAIDAHPATVAEARRHVAGDPDIEVIELDARELLDRFDAGSFDYAHAGLFLHHLADIDVLTVLAAMRNLTTRGVIWNDLVRGAVGLAGAKLLTRTASEMVRHDAVVSVQAGFTKAEALDFARRVGLREPRFRRHLCYRFTLVARS